MYLNKIKVFYLKKKCNHTCFFSYTLTRCVD